MADKYVSTHTGAEIDAAVDRATSLTFNPTIPSGVTPTALTGIKDGNNYYQPQTGSSGTQLYKHVFNDPTIGYAYSGGSGSSITSSSKKITIISKNNAAYSSIADVISDAGVVAIIAEFDFNEFAAASGTYKLFGYCVNRTYEKCFEFMRWYDYNNIIRFYSPANSLSDTNISAL